MTEEVSTKPYLIRAIHEWAVDNGYTPYLAVAVNEQTQVPREFVKAGEIVLNVSPFATNKLQLGNEWIEFEARFGGVARSIMVPVDQVSAIYARENGHGMAFEVHKPLSEIEGDGNEAVQFVFDEADEEASEPAERGGLKPVSGAAEQSDSLVSVVKSEPGDENSPKKPGPKGKSHLTRVK
ncbi:MAG: ClpXP protease specificity-enhancing factor [Limnobacter sp.]|uniref:ClpXP protease specificity-enhancing factor n=1 Tax=Limnobacter sp. TaxID=2003368 RepID=UPI00391DED89